MIAMVEKQSEIGRDAQLAMLLQHKWQAEIEQAISRIKKSYIRSEADKSFRKQWYRALAASKRQELRVAKRESSQTAGCGGD